MNAITWSHPMLLGLLPLVPLALLVQIAWRRRLHQQQRRLGLGDPDLDRRHSRSREVLRQVLLTSGLALLIVTLAGPRWGASSATRSDRGANLIFLLDCSRSMLAEDLYPNRLDTARRKARDLLADSPEHRVALIPFAAVATLRTPLTGDHQAAQEMLEECGPDLFPAELGYQGTAIGAAVELALKLQRDGDRGQAIIIFSDGSDPDQAAVESAAEAAFQAGVPVYGLFLGDPESSVSLTIDGQEQTMNADRASLDLLARRSGAISVNASVDEADIHQLRQHLAAHVKQAPWEEQRRIVQSERYRWFLLPALALISLAHFLPLCRRESLS